MPEVSLNDMRVGDSIAWKGGGMVFHVLSLLLFVFDASWRRRKWKPWHTGFVVKVLAEGEIVTSQAIGSGIHTLTYESAEAMGDCRFFRWLTNPDQERVEEYAQGHEREHYDYIGYLWNAVGNLSMYLLKYPFRVVDNAKFCWEHASEFDRWMGREVQPEAEPCNIARMMNAWEGNTK